MTGPGGPSGRTALVGLDGATFEILTAAVTAGAMPSLSRMLDSGMRAVLRSTIPTYTPPAWVSMATGVNPGRHGIFGFLANTPQEPTEICHSGLIGSPPMWRYLDELGVPAGIFNVPMTYPPVEVRGFMVAGGIAAGWTDPELPNFASTPELGQRVTEIAGGPYPLDTVVSYENEWRSVGSVDRIRDIQRTRRKVLEALLEENDVSFLFAVFEGPDRLQHLHYQYLVECSNWYASSQATAFRDHAFRYFEELDAAIATVHAWAGPDGHVCIVSDHGFGPWEKTLNVNVLLEEWGFLKAPRMSRITSTPAVAGPIQRLARRTVPRPLLHRLKARVGRSIAWPETRAFASHVAEQGIHINALTELPHGVLDEGATSRAETELVQRLDELVDPADGEPVVDRVVRRRDAISGEFSARAPHLFPLCRDQRFELSDTLAASSFLTDHRDRPWGYHHIDGVFIATGPGIRSGTHDGGLDIVDVLPTSFHLAGLPVPAGLDGKVRTEMLAAGRPIVERDLNAEHQRVTDNPYSAEEEASIEDSLRGLGYIE